MTTRLIGLEYEFLGIQGENGQAVTRDIMKAIWRDWGTQKHVETYYDYATKQPVGVTYTQSDGRDIIINTDAGINVIEFGFMPYATLAECEANMREVIADFLSVAKKYNVKLLAYGLQPKTPHYYADLKTEKIWYRGFARFPYFAAGHNMFHNIAANQPCIDVTYDEMLPVLNLFNAIGGVTIALFANSGFGEWVDQCCLEEREHRWNRWMSQAPETRKISGLPTHPFNSFRDYLEYNWTIALPASHRNRTLHVIEPAPQIIDYLRQREWQTMDVGIGEPSRITPNMEDVNMSNMYIWTQARPKYFFKDSAQLPELLTAYDAGREAVDTYAREHLKILYIETRNIACQPWNEIMTAPAFLLGLIENIKNAQQITARKTWQEWNELRENTIREGFAVTGVDELAAELLDLAEAGLRKREHGEEHYLTPLRKRIADRTSPSQQARAMVQSQGIQAFIDAQTVIL
jgi:gamma-glutamylcysteine synthetase